MCFYCLNDQPTIGIRPFLQPSCFVYVRVCLSLSVSPGHLFSAFRVSACLIGYQSDFYFDGCIIVCLYLFICLFVCPSVFLTGLCLFVCMFVWLLVCLFVVCKSIC